MFLLYIVENIDPRVLLLFYDNDGGKIKSAVQFYRTVFRESPWEIHARARARYVTTAVINALESEIASAMQSFFCNFLVSQSYSLGCAYNDAPPLLETPLIVRIGQQWGSNRHVSGLEGDERAEEEEESVCVAPERAANTREKQREREKES